MKILHVLNELMASGAEVSLRAAASRLQAAGIAGECLSTGEGVGPYARDLEEAGYRIHHIRFRKDPRFLLTFFRLVRHIRCEIVHIHCERAFFWYGLTARLAGAKIVRTICATFPFTGFLAVRRSVHRRLFHWLGGQMISVSPSVEQNEITRFRNPTTVVLNWFDDTRFVPPSVEERRAARQQHGIQTDALGVISVGNCHPVKNHRELLRALAMIKEEIPFVYLHVGREEEGWPERRLAEELSIADRARFLGYKSSSAESLRAADVYVMCSLREGLSVAALEALGVGLPAVLSDVDGLRELKGIPGVTWTTPDAESIAAGIRQVEAVNRTERGAVGRRASREVRMRFGMERGVRAHVALYEKALRRGRRRRRLARDNRNGGV